MTIDQLKSPVAEAFRQFEERYNNCIYSQTPLLDEVGKYLSITPGKRLRPLLVLLSAQACGTLHPHHIQLATAMELLHNATLMHDDVVDESDQRRGHESVRRHWGNQTAVLCGDYYLAQVMALLHEVGDSEASKLVSRTVATMSQGELWQLALTQRHETSLEDYLTVIGDKTASLMKTCCQLGAMTFGNRPGDRYIENMQQFGYHYGMVFQLQDDMKSLDKLHDVALPEGIDPHGLVDDHANQAILALEGIPDSPARNALLALLSPAAPLPE